VQNFNSLDKFKFHSSCQLLLQNKLVHEDLWNFSQSEHIIGSGSHIEYPTGTKNSNFVEDHPRSIPAKFLVANCYYRINLYMFHLFYRHDITEILLKHHKPTTCSIIPLLVHLDQRSMWTIAITWHPSSVVCKLFTYFVQAYS
jgi:hypothetical protein